MRRRSRYSTPGRGMPPSGAGCGCSPLHCAALKIGSKASRGREGGRGGGGRGGGPAPAGDPSLVARAQALLGLLIDYRGDYGTAVATMAGAADMIDRLPPGSGAARRREQQIDKAVNRSTLVGCLAHGGRLTEARAQGESYLATFTESATAPSEL